MGANVLFRICRSKSLRSAPPPVRIMPKSIITGEDIMKILDIEPGQKVGEILKEIREQQLDDKITTNYRLLN